MIPAYLVDFATRIEPILALVAVALIALFIVRKNENGQSR